MYYFYWLPVGTDVRVRSTPWVTLSIVLTNLFVHGIFLASRGDAGTLYALAFKAAQPTVATALASLFLHAGFLHLVGNLVFLSVFGPPLEARLGAARFTIAHNLLTNVGLADGGELDRLYLVLGAMADVAIEHNTGFAPHAFLQFGDPSGAPMPRLTFRNNVGGDSRYIYNSPRGDGTAMFTAYGVPLASVAGNCVVTAESYYLPKGSTYAATRARAGLGGDYRLGSGSPCRGRATDGTDPGADIATLYAKTRNAVVPQ